MRLFLGQAEVGFPKVQRKCSLLIAVKMTEDKLVMEKGNEQLNTLFQAIILDHLVI